MRIKKTEAEYFGEETRCPCQAFESTLKVAEPHEPENTIEDLLNTLSHGFPLMLSFSN